MERDRAPFPEGGKGWDSLQAAMAAKSGGDIDWRAGRSPAFVFRNDEETLDIGRKAFFEYFAENGLGGKRAFFGIGQMEDEVLDYGLDLFQAPDDAAGAFTSGGTESIFLAIKAARDAFRAANGGARGSLNVVMPDSAHAAFDKAADVLDIELRRAPLAADRRADAETMRPLVDDRTFLLVGSAPCYPHGVIDPIDRIGQLAVDTGIWLHVDACVGGWIAPFFHRIGRPIPHFDFRFPGVRSISADLHKFGFCPKPASTVFYRDRTDMERARFVADKWPSGVFQTTTFSGTRPGGAVAAAWAVLNHLGIAGYERAARNLAEMVDAYVADISAINGMRFWARPDVTIINFGSDEFDIFAVAKGMTQRGWLPGLTRRPKGLHQMMSMLHAPAREAYVSDLRGAIADVREGKQNAENIVATY